MIHLSPAATSEIKRLEENFLRGAFPPLDTTSKLLQPLWFRLAVKVGGCSGLYYDMSFEQDINLDDITFVCNGIQVAVDSQSSSYINGLTLDYSEDLMGGGFRFHNPQATSSCGCGNSFVCS
ncbi:HesB/YadR/YfhF-family protein [Calothrix sp. NIES-4071]|nr:HesB/YadR/YfhF-family protein [Calothrix sp. NIES-4071]BAZ61664.1 HesB/YadR/YfhF-family protein [Calothrix sp. NIES-4105]